MKKVVETIALLNKANESRAIRIGKALASPMRLAILRQLRKKPLKITEIAQLNEITNSTAIFHLRLLEEAEFVKLEYIPSKKGQTQICYLAFDSILLTDTSTVTEPTVDTWEQSIPIGMYVDADFYGNVRFASEKDFIKIDRLNPFDARRAEAQIIGADGGRLTYAFDNTFAFNRSVMELQVSFELCSEVINYHHDWKSDITFYLNGLELFTYTSPGDYGNIRGRLNPSWWPNNVTQYGDYILIHVNSKGVYLNQTCVNPKITLDDLHLSEGNKILFTLFTKPDSAHYGGFNLFGCKFGNHPQDVVLTATFEQD